MFREEDKEEAIRRLLGILKNLSDELQLAVCLPILLQEEKFFKLLETDEERLFRRLQNSYSISNQSSKEIIHEEDDNQIDDPRFGQVFKILLSNPKVRILARELFENVSPSSKSLIEYFNQFTDIIEERIRKDPLEERNHILKLKNTAEDLERIQIELNSLQNILDEERNNHLKSVKEISREISKYELIINDFQEEHQKNIKEIVNKADTEVIKIQLELKEREKSLRNEIEEYNRKIEKLFEENEKKEKVLNEIRLKAEKRCMAAKTRYDTNIGELDEIKRELTLELEDITREYLNLQEKVTAQMIIYRELRDEKEGMIIESLNKNIENFTRNRSAKIIQIWWREYLARKASIKKKKEKKKRKESKK